MMHEFVTSILLETPSGELIFQHRDDIPNIEEPGKISTFGGHREADETIIQCALRELEEETTLIVSQHDLESIGYIVSDLEKRDNYLFIVRNVDIQNITIREGQGYMVVSKADDLSKINLSILARFCIRMYWKI